MTNSLIPHTFVPGTKAKAQEVNANFIALAEEIQSTQTNVSSRLSQLSESITEAENSISESVSDKNLINTKMLGNVILEAPNGIIVYDNQTITAKNGLRLLVPSGLDTDGKMLSVDFSLTSDVSKTVTTMTNVVSTVFLNINGTLDVVLKSNVFYSDTSSITDGSYKYINNKWYKYSLLESIWQEASVIPIADVTWNAQSIISKVYSYPISKLVTTCDLGNLNQLKTLLPSTVDYVIEEKYVGDIYVRRYKSGWVELSGYVAKNVTLGSWKSSSHTINLPYSIQIYSADILPNSCIFCCGLSNRSNTSVTFELNNTYSKSATLADFFWNIKGKIL